MRALPWIVLALAIAAPAASQSCPSIQYRLWRHGEPTWFDSGTPVPIPLGEQVQVYVQVRSRSETPYLAEAELGWPWEMGYAMPTPVESPIAIEEQSGEDREAGRISVRGKKAGRANLAYRIERLAAPGRLEDVPESCRHGLIPLLVEDAEDGAPEPAAGAEEQEGPKVLLEDSFDGAGRIDPAVAGMTILNGASVELRRDRTATLSFWSNNRRTAQEFTATWKRSEAGYRLALERGPDGRRLDGPGVVTVTDGVVQRLDLRGVYGGGASLSVAFARTGSTDPVPDLGD